MAKILQLNRKTKIEMKYMMNRIFWFDVFLLSQIIITQFCGLHSTMRPTFLQSELSSTGIHMLREKQAVKKIYLSTEIIISLKNFWAALIRLFLFSSTLCPFSSLFGQNYFLIVTKFRRLNPQTASSPNVQFTCPLKFDT